MKVRPLASLLAAGLIMRHPGCDVHRQNYEVIRSRGNAWLGAHCGFLCHKYAGCCRRNGQL